MWIFFVFFISLPLGGILNGYRYVSNEGWWVKPKGFTTTTTAATASTYSSPDDTPTSPSSALSKSTGKQIIDDRHHNPYHGNSVELKKIETKHDNNDDIIEIGNAV